MSNAKDVMALNAGLVLRDGVILATANFDVYIGRLPEDQVDQFIIINRAYNVVEFTCNSEHMLRFTVKHMESAMAELNEPVPTAQVVPIRSDKH